MVYPRVCGEPGVRLPFAPFGDGLSPRVRGNLMEDGRVTHRLRSIPACAGEP